MFPLKRILKNTKEADKIVKSEDRQDHKSHKTFDAI